MTDARQRFFEHMSNEHGLTLLESDMHDIISLVKEILKEDPDLQILAKANFEWLTGTVREYNQFKADAETDIGYLAEAFSKLTNVKSPMKLVTKLVLGQMDVSELGLDFERMKQISAKYAPVTTARLDAANEPKK